jgi:GPH family glycoside/pentoside/hexuronide:cation symporter
MAAEALPRRAKVLYSASSFGSSALSQTRNFWLIFFWAPPEDEPDLTTYLSRTTLGVLLTVGRIAESFDDPVIGWLSDRTSSRLGRRVPYILAFTPLYALTFIFLWTPPENESGWTNALYLFVVFALLNLFGTFSGGPHEALMPEIARGRQDRIDIGALTAFLGIAGAGLGLMVSGLLIEFAGYVVMAVFIAALMLVLRLTSTIAAYRYIDREQKPITLGLRESLAAALSNTHFRAFLPSFVCFQLALTMLIALIPFYVSEILELSEGLYTSILIGIALGVMLLTLPFLRQLAARWGPGRSFGYSLLGSAVTFPLLSIAGLLPWMPDFAEVLLVLLLIAVPLAGVFLFPAPIIADIVDDDETVTGARREATFFGTQEFVEKMSYSLAPLIFALLLLLGETSDDPLGLRLVGPVAGFIVFLGWLSFRGYALDAGDGAGSSSVRSAAAVSS